MGRRMRWLPAVLALSLFAAQPVQADETAGQEDSPRLEQVYLNMPEITVYGYGLEEAGASPEAWLGDERLTPVSASSFSETGEGVSYYVLLDVSNSIPESYFNQLKEGICDFWDGLAAGDTATLITFGESVKVLQEAGAGMDAVRESLQSVDNIDNRTMLFEAVSQAADLADRSQGASCRRKVFIVISDGEDVAVGEKRAQEALDELKEKGIPVYGACIRDTALDHINSFGEFARRSGGDVHVFEADQARGVLEEIRGELTQAEVLEFAAPTNRITNEYETFSLRIQGQDAPLTREVLSCRWIPDEEAPVILEAVKGEERQILVTFSEPVSGADQTSAYTLTRRGETVVIQSAVYAAERRDQVVLTAAEPLNRGEYALNCQGVRDDSQEQNPVSGDFTFELSTGDPQPGIDPGSQAVLFGCLLAAAAVIIAAVVVVRRNQKAKEVIVVDGQSITASSVSVKQHVTTGQPEKKTFWMVVSVEGRNPKKMELSIDRSLIVGRADICDLYFDDGRMSRQHFALEWDGSSMYVTDLNTTNGTTVNGVKITGRRRLEPGDRVCAGAEEMEISW